MLFWEEKNKLTNINLNCNILLRKLTCTHLGIYYFIFDKLTSEYYIMSTTFKFRNLVENILLKFVRLPEGKQRQLKHVLKKKVCNIVKNVKSV